jgi:hypothetical protein
MSRSCDAVAMARYSGYRSICPIISINSVAQRVRTSSRISKVFPVFDWVNIRSIEVNNQAQTYAWRCSMSMIVAFNALAAVLGVGLLAYVVYLWRGAI